MENSSRARSIFKIVVIIVVLLVAWSLFDSFRYRGLVKVDVVALPDTSEITVDGTHKKGGTLHLKPGKHVFKATLADFGDDIETIDTHDLEPTDKIYLLPKATSSAAKRWLLTHPDVQRQREAGGGAMAAFKQRELTKNFPILERLPYENEHFKIDYSLPDDNKLELTITLFGILNRPSQYDTYLQQLKDYKIEALKYLKDHGVNPTTYKITYIPNDPDK